MSTKVIPIDKAALLDWEYQVHQAFRESRWGPAVNVNGIDALDILVTPLHRALLIAVHEEPSGVFTQLWRRLRWRGYRFKMGWYEQKTCAFTAPVRPASIVFWPQHLNHINPILPVARSLEDRGVSCAFLTGQPKVFDQLKSRGVDPVFSLGVWGPELREARRRGARLTRILSQNPDVKLPPFPIPGVNIPTVDIFRNVIREHLPFVYDAVSTAELAIQHFDMDVFVPGNDITQEGRATCMVAKDRGVPTAVLMHGNVSGSPTQRLHLSDLFIVHGQGDVDSVVAQGGDPTKIVACGAPYLEGRAIQTGEPHSTLQKRFGLRRGQPWVLVATSGSGITISRPHHITAIENVMRLSVAMPDVTFIAKLHHQDQPWFYQQALKAVPDSRMHIVPNATPGLPTSILEWLQGCPVVLTGASTVAVEAMLMQVPVITMDFCDEIHGMDFIEGGSTAHITTEAQLGERVRQYLANPNALPEVEEARRRYLERSNAHTAGAPDKTADAILSLVKRSVSV